MSKNFSRALYTIQSNLDISKLMGLFLQVQISRSANEFALRVIWTCKKVSNAIYSSKSNQNVFLIQIDASKIAEFEISEFEISRFDCICI